MGGIRVAHLHKTPLITSPSTDPGAGRETGLIPPLRAIRLTHGGSFLIPHRKVMDRLRTGPPHLGRGRSLMENYEAEVCVRSCRRSSLLSKEVTGSTPRRRQEDLVSVSNRPRDPRKLLIFSPFLRP